MTFSLSRRAMTSRVHSVFRLAPVFWFVVVCTSVCAAADLPSGLSAEEGEKFDRELMRLDSDLRAMRGDPKAEPASEKANLLPDAAVFPKGIQWALRYETELKPADVALIDKALGRGRQRVELLQAGKPAWMQKRGRVVRGYVSAVDGSVQPYGVIIPKSYDPQKPIRLDVVLHGSTKPVGLSELRFMDRFDEGDEDSSKAPDQTFIELHPLGRVENCYRWAGETDVFEAIEDVCRKYAVDRDRIVLRGMSMGASGTWHLGLKHPDRFVALGPYCGYVDTHRFSETPLPNFVKVGPLPEHQELGLHMLDSVDYAANAGVVPAIACMGEKDVFFQAHVIMGEAMRREGLEMVNLISPGTGHVIDPVTHAEQMRRIAGYVDKGLDHLPRQIRFVTWTLKYPRCHWLEVERLEQHYARAEISAQLGDGFIDIAEPKNISRFSILSPVLPENHLKVRIGKRRFHLDDIPANPQARKPVTFVKRDKGWEAFSGAGPNSRFEKRPSLQGPIDDAFTSRFLCVRGTGKPWNPAVQAYADASLKRFAYEWNRYFRGDLPIKDDTAVTEDDVRQSNLILFGDPGSNPWIRKVLPHLPITWTEKTLKMGDTEYPAADHVPALIHPNPLPAGTNRYIVLNSGHTFRESELSLLNYLLFPRWGDWAVLKVGGTVPEKPGDQLHETVLRAGFFNEQWHFR